MRQPTLAQNFTALEQDGYDVWAGAASAQRIPGSRLRLPVRTVLIAAAMVGGLNLSGAPSPATNAAPRDLLVTGSMGEVVTVPADEVPEGLVPSRAPGATPQIPAPRRGAKVPAAVRQRLEESRQADRGFQWFPSTAPRLAPYLGAQDEFGNTALLPGPLIRSTPLDGAVQSVKLRLSDVGLRYSLKQTMTVLAMSDVMQGDDVLGFYTLSLSAKWAMFDTADSGTAGWISTAIQANTGLGTAGNTQSAQGNLGTLTDPTGVWTGVQGLQIPELAWQQSFREGRFVAVAGMVNQGSYLDANGYANSGAGQFLNSALINSMVLPLPSGNPGLNLQWQPDENWHLMLGASAGNSPPGNTPWTDFTWDYWSAVCEIGYAPDDVLGLGPGVYRLQPFIAQAGGPAQGGLGLNAQQQLGQHTPLGWFGRFGLGGSEVTAGASAQIGTGLVLQGPLALGGLLPSRQHDIAMLGFTWSQPSATAKPVAHHNEYVLEAGYVLQLTPTVQLQPDLQYVWNPAYNPDSSRSLVVQLQLDLLW